MPAIGDLRDFDIFLIRQCAWFRKKLRDQLAGKRLTLREIRRHRVLLPMVGVYTPGWQALPACSWEFVEIVTKEGPIGTGEWSIRLDQPAIDAIERLQAEPGKNLLDEDLEVPLFMAWWDLVGQVLGKPLHELWAELFDVGFDPPTEIPLAGYSWQRFPDSEGRDAVGSPGRAGRYRGHDGLPSVTRRSAHHGADISRRPRSHPPLNGGVSSSSASRRASGQRP